MEPPHTYVRDASASVVHHTDYLDSRDDHALCGAVLTNSTAVGQTERPDAACPDCEARLVEYHVSWWRDTALAATAELDDLKVEYRRLAARVEGREATVSQPTADVAQDSGAEVPLRREVDAGEPPGDGAAERADVSLLDRARAELLTLCRQFDDAVPFRRVKTTMQALSDTLSPGERVLLAQEIGADGSLIRWSTTEIESLGWQVADNPVHGQTEAMWDAWTRDSSPPPKQSKWRLGRSRSHDGG